MGFWVQSSVFPKQRLHYSVKPTFLISSTYHLLNSIWKLRNEDKVETRIRSRESPASHEWLSNQLWIGITWELWQDPAPEQVNQNLTKGKWKPSNRRACRMHQAILICSGFLKIDVYNNQLTHYNCMRWWNIWCFKVCIQCRIKWLNEGSLHISHLKSFVYCW